MLIRRYNDHTFVLPTVIEESLLVLYSSVNRLGLCGRRGTTAGGMEASIPVRISVFYKSTNEATLE